MVSIFISLLVVLVVHQIKLNKNISLTASLNMLFLFNVYLFQVTINVLIVNLELK